ncbi:MAG: ABC transporter permease [Clostridium sp.]
MIKKDLYKRSWNNLKRNKGRTALTILSTIIGSATLITLLSIGSVFKEKIVDNYKEDVDTLKIEANHHGNILQSDDESLKLLEDIRKIQGVNRASVIGIIEGNLSLKIGDKEITPLVVAVDESTLKAINGEFLSGGSIKDKDGAILSGKDMGLIKENQEITINANKYFENDENREITFRVDGVLKKDDMKLVNKFDINSNGEKKNIIYFPIEKLDEITKPNFFAKVKNFQIYAESELKVQGIVESLKSFRLEASALYLDVKSIENYLNIMMIILGGMGIISLLVASISISNTMNMVVEERKGEIGILKSIGIAPKDLKELFTLESIYISILGGAGGILLSFIASILINIIFRNNVPYYAFELSNVMSISILPVIISLIITFFINYIASFRAIKIAMEMEIVNVLREE